MSIILIGFMGAGKSSVSKLLDDKYMDLDTQIERQIQMPISRFFELFGEAEFRQIESEIFQSAVLMNFTIATGGGIVESKINRKILENQNQVVYLSADFETLLSRIRHDNENVRPLAEDLAVLKTRFDRRKKYYESLSNLTIDTSNLTVEEIVAAIREKFPKEK